MHRETDTKEVRDMEKQILPTGLQETKEDIIEKTNDDEIKPVKNRSTNEKDHEGSKQKVKENHATMNHQISQREAISDTKKEDDIEHKNKALKDNEDSKQKVKEDHTNHQVSQKKAMSNTTKDDDTEKNTKARNNHEGSKQKVKEIM